MPGADFEPLRPRRYGASVTPPEHAEAQPGHEATPEQESRPAQESSSVQASPPVPQTPPRSAVGLAAPASMGNDIALEQQRLEEANAEGDQTEEPAAAPSGQEDEEGRAAMMRDEAIRFASIATARALRTTLAHDAAALTRYVDDALRACGRITSARVRLHPADAASYRPQRDVEIIADAGANRGGVVVETDAGIMSATIEERASLLVRAAARA